MKVYINNDFSDEDIEKRIRSAFEKEDTVLTGDFDELLSCDAYVGFAIDTMTATAMGYGLSYCDEIELDTVLHSSVPVIAVKQSPSDRMLMNQGLAWLTKSAQVRVFDLTSGAEPEELPAFIRGFLSDLGREPHETLPDDRLEKPYEGDQPFMFVSYSHKDRDKVFPVIARMQKEGCRLWYDEGVHAASQWDEFIARHISRCAYVIAFISKNYIESENCRDEINYARDLNKERLLVYLDKTDLPMGMAMRLKRLQAIYRYECGSGEEFYEKLFSAKGLDITRSDTK